MTSLTNRENLHSDVVIKLAQAQAGESPPPVLPDHLKDWLAQLTLLYGVPVEYLVPDIRLLPIESIRFFYLDRNWLDRLVDGAMSVGVLSSADAVFNLSFFKQIYDQVDSAQMTLRSTLREAAPSGSGEVGGPITGFIFRSQVVADFPGIEINPTQEGKALPILRMDTLSSNTLLCIFSGVPDKVEFIQPGEGLHFGLFPNDPPQDGSDFHLFLRGLGEGGYPAGVQIEDGHGTKLRGYGSFRSGNGQPAGVVDIGGLVNNISGTLPSGASKDGKLTSGGFAIQMTKTAQKQPYESGSNFPPCTPSTNTDQEKL
ncbi:hypothetical protein SAMN04489724_0101 [Algoriphagus locisalis]|uniref:Uncharacterized protein n=1 Tax=Algoriphagus locisalis TaxID=305507 RepID=A0A1I7E587_9BACT|nr:hypothetical protein [Algoriphagus locisalis]SFU19107.1 hypothetical protein SAMN04489724_0101 [Algoriphagus locisalis]